MILISIFKCNYKLILGGWMVNKSLVNFLLNEYLWTLQINFGSGNDLVPSGNNNQC